jgi:hypothetical protein
VLAYEPDLVLLQYFVNDIYAQALGEKFDQRRGMLFRLTAPRRGGWIGGLRSASRAADLVLHEVFQREKARGNSLATAALYADESEQWRAVREALRSASDELEAAEVDFAVVMFPMLVESGGHFVSHDALEVVSRFCASEGIACFDGEPALLANGGEELWVSRGDWHANGAAYRIFGGEVAEWLEQQGLLD